MTVYAVIVNVGAIFIVNGHITTIPGSGTSSSHIVGVVAAAAADAVASRRQHNRHPVWRRHADVAVLNGQS